MSTKLGLALFVLAVVAVAMPRSGQAAPGDDGYIEGYAAALLEREFKITAPSLRVSNGVVTLGAWDLGGVERARVVAALERIRGVARVVILDLPEAPVPTGPPPPPPPPRVLEHYDVGPLPGGLLFKPLIADPRWPHFAATYQSFQHEHDLHDVAAVSFGETFALYRDGSAPVGGTSASRPGSSPSSTWTRRPRISSTPTTWWPCRWAIATSSSRDSCGCSTSRATWATSSSCAAGSGTGST